MESFEILKDAWINYRMEKLTLLRCKFCDTELIPLKTRRIDDQGYTTTHWLYFPKCLCATQKKIDWKESFNTTNETIYIKDKDGEGNW